MDVKQEFVAAIRKHFEQLNSLLDTELASATSDPFPESRFFLVEYESPHFSEDFPVSVWAMNTCGEPVAEGHWFLKGSAVVVPAAIYEDEKYDSIEPWDTASELLEEWFMSRWVVSVTCALPAFIGHHDSYFKRSLLTGEQVSWDSVVQSVNG